MRILIVTARPQAFTAFAATLGEKGLETAFVPTGQAALESARISPPTLCVVDEHGRQLGIGRNLGALKGEWGGKARGAFQALAGLSVRGTAASAPATEGSAEALDVPVQPAKGNGARAPSREAGGGADRAPPGVLGPVGGPFGGLGPPVEVDGHAEGAAHGPLHVRAQCSRCGVNPDDSRRHLCKLTQLLHGCHLLRFDEDVFPKPPVETIGATSCALSHRCSYGAIVHHDARVAPVTRRLEVPEKSAGR